MEADLILDATAACQLVAVTNCNDDGRFKEKRIPSLKQKKRERNKLKEKQDIFKTKMKNQSMKITC